MVTGLPDRLVSTVAPARAAYGSPVVDVALADKIASLRHALVTDTPVSKRKLAAQMPDSPP